ncbi:MAG: amidohydrolase family protein [Verrucomicrobiota bacterium]
MTTTRIDNVRLVVPGEKIATGSLRLAGGKITAVDFHPVAGKVPLLTPGLIDVHTHGIERHIYEAGPAALQAGAMALARYGTTSVLPTLYAALTRSKLSELDALAGALEKTSLPGFHLEGPFLALAGAGAHTMPGDLGLLAELLAACRQRVRAMSISPETPNIVSVIQRLRETGISVFMTHTRASVDQTEAAIAAGAQHATHFYDVFPVPVETEPGVRPVGAVEAILADRRASVDFIADGVHVHPVAIKAALAAKGWAGIVLISDSNIGAGLTPGIHETPWGYRVRVAAGDAARHETQGFLAGSALTMNAGIRNLLRWLDLPAEQVWAMGTLNPARLAGLAGKGRMAVGADADLVLWDENLEPLKTWVGGECIYEKV